MWISSRNSSFNRAIDGKINRILDHKASGKTDVETYHAIRAEDNHKNKVLLVIVAVVVFLVWFAKH